ncbi:MAG: FtsX-like permease family protein, partial [bacterium]
SMAIITLMALGAFSIIITGANRKTFVGSENDRNSGTGGFILWTESSFPVGEDLNTREGKKHYTLDDEPALKNVRFVQMHQLDGEDASCLNLNQVSRPVILSVDPRLFDSERCFTVLQGDGSFDREQPWRVLNEAPVPGVINAFADQTVITWGLRKKIGDTLYYLDESGSPLKVVLKGGLDNSIFQGSLLVSDSLFRIYFPSAPRSRIMLIDGPYEKRAEIASRLENLFRDHGMMAFPASQRLAAFNAVENTYLSIFMLLGGLGILVGTIGLSVVLLRNLYERRSEIAIYKAIGFSGKKILRIVITEYLHLLLAGAVAGVVPALLAILPSMLSPSFTAMGGMLVIITLLILVNGSLWIFFLAKKAVKVDIHEVLKAE